jgi:hypothetical protein
VLILNKIIAQFDYFFEATFMDLGPTGEAVGVIKDTRMDFTMIIDLTTGKATLVEDDFNISDVGYKILKNLLQKKNNENSSRINIDISGLGFGLNWLAEIFVNLFVDVFKSVIVWLIEDEVFKLLQQAIANIVFGYLAAVFV